jgi:fatty-acyl-CoA synthase
MLNERLAANRWFTSTTQQLLVETCQDRPEKTAIVFQEEEISFSELQQKVDILSQALINLGVGRGDHVAVLPTSSPEFTYLHFATLQIGALINPLNLLWGVTEFTGILRRNDPKIIVTTDENRGRDYVTLLRDSVPDLILRDGTASSKSVPALTHVVTFSRQGRRHEGFLDFSELMESGSRYDEDSLRAMVEASRCTDVQYMCQTSGSTGLSKSALWNHRSALASVNFTTKCLNYSEDDSYLCLTPFFHNSGMMGLNLTLALTGTTLYLMENFDPTTAMQLIDRHGISTTGGFDAHWQALRMIQKSGDFRFAISKVIGAISPKTYDLIAEEMCSGRDVTIATLYAQTENGPMVSLTEPDCMTPEIRRGANGRPLPGVAVVIKDVASGEVLPPDRQGEICYKSPFMFSGYYKQEEETRRLFDEEGYFHSGDYGTFKDGYIHFLGRLGGVVKSGGENVSTTYVSSLLMDIFPEEFEDVLTVGVPDPYWGTKIVSLVRQKPGKELRPAKDLRAACKGSMAEYEIPRDFLEWEGQWPMTAEGKMDFKMLQREVEKRLAAIGA